MPTLQLCVGRGWELSQKVCCRLDKWLFFLLGGFSGCFTEALCAQCRRDNALISNKSYDFTNEGKFKSSVFLYDELFIHQILSEFLPGFRECVKSRERVRHSLIHKECAVK